VTLLTRIETLISDVLDEFSAIEKNVEKNVRELLLTAQGAIVSARDFVSALPSSEVRQKAAKKKAKSRVKAKKRVTAPAAKKRALKAF
jgi:phage baseplate assembly protein W